MDNSPFLNLIRLYFFSLLNEHINEFCLKMFLEIWLNLGPDPRCYQGSTEWEMQSHDFSCNLKVKFLQRRMWCKKNDGEKENMDYIISFKLKQCASNQKKSLGHTNTALAKWCYIKKASISFIDVSLLHYSYIWNLEISRVLLCLR